MPRKPGRVGRYKRATPIVGSKGRRKAHLDRVDELRQRYLDASRIADPVARESAAMSLAQAEVHMQVVSAMEADGSLTGDESKAIPSLLKEIRALRAEHGLMGIVEDDDELQL
jgi:hypothetical protein